MNDLSTKTSLERSKVYEMLLCSPGMNDPCKIVLQLCRKNVLLLGSIIEQGVQDGPGHAEKDGWTLPEGSREELKGIAGEIIKKGGLTEFYERWKAF